MKHQNSNFKQSGLEQTSHALAEMQQEMEKHLKQNLDCVTDNKTRLKHVKNLEELINFKIKTVVTETVENNP